MNTKLVNRSHYKVGDLITYDDSKVFGHVVKVEPDFIQVVNDQGKIEDVLAHKINKRIQNDRRQTDRDSMGNGVQVGDYVSVNRSGQ